MRAPGWVVSMLRAWGAQCRRVHDGGVIYPDGAIHVDGWPETSVSAFGERVSRATGAVRQHFDEVYRGAGLEVWRVLRASPEIVRSVLIIHYVVRRSAGGEPIGPDGKAEIMGVSWLEYKAQRSGRNGLNGSRPTSPRHR